MATKIFFIYDPQDGKHLTEIENQLRVLVVNEEIEYWHQGKLLAGTPWLSETKTQLQAAQIVLPIVSANFLASNECNEWLKMADKLGKQIVPIIAGSCLWQYDRILKDKTPLPRKDNDTAATPLNKWTYAADAYENVVMGIAALVEVQASRNETDHLKQNSNNFSSKNITDMTAQNLTFDNGYALLIGVGYYEHCRSLPITISDAKIMQQVLTDTNRAAYPPKNTHLIIPNRTQGEYVTASKMETALTNFVDMVNANKNANKTAIIYYSGHGDVYNGTHYLCPYNYQVGNDEVKNGISAAYFVSQINKIEADRILVLLDCCYAGGIKATDRLADKLKEGKGRVIIASSTDKQTSKILYGASYSLFTDILVEALAGLCMNNADDKVVRVLQLASYIDEKLRDAKQEQNLQINKADGLQSFPICAYNRVYEQKNPIKAWVQSFWKKTAEENGWDIPDLHPNPNPIVSINAIETAYKNADWVEVINLLDDYFGDNPTPNYSTLKATIENALSQGLQPTVANQQALKMMINQIKRQG